MSSSETVESDAGGAAAKAAEDAARRSRHDRVLGLRGKLEYYYGGLKKEQQRNAAEHTKLAGREKAFVLDVIGVADSFENVFRGFEESKKLQKQKDVLECFRTTYETLLDVLEKQGIYQVPVQGKGYNDVVFEGVRIPEPWVVVSVQDTGAKNEKKVAQRVIRALWVRVIGSQVAVLRKAQVTY